MNEKDRNTEGEEARITMSSIILYDVDSDDEPFPDTEDQFPIIKKLIYNKASIIEIEKHLKQAQKDEYYAEETILQCAMNNNRLDVIKLIIQTDITYISNKNQFYRNALEFAYNAPDEIHDFFFQTLCSVDIDEKKIALLFHPTKNYINSKLISLFKDANKPNLASAVIAAEIDYLQNEFAFASQSLRDGAKTQMAELKIERDHINKMIELDQQYHHQNEQYLLNRVIDAVIEDVIIGQYSYNDDI